MEPSKFASLPDSDVPVFQLFNTPISMILSRFSGKLSNDEFNITLCDNPKKLMSLIKVINDIKDLCTSHGYDIENDRDII